MYTKTKVLSWKEICGIQNTGIEDYQKNIIVHQRKVLKFGRIMLQSCTIALIGLFDPKT